MDRVVQLYRIRPCRIYELNSRRELVFESQNPTNGVNSAVSCHKELVQYMYYS